MHATTFREPMQPGIMVQQLHKGPKAPARENGGPRGELTRARAENRRLGSQPVMLSDPHSRNP
jgi:hypothetical protein